MTTTPFTLTAETLAINGFPAEWSSWVVHYSTSHDDPWSELHTVYRPEPPSPTVEEWDEDCDGEAFCIDRKRTPDQMRIAVEFYEHDLAQWIAEHGDADKAEVRYRLGPDEWRVMLTGANGERAKLVSADGHRWKLLEWHGFEADGYVDGDGYLTCSRDDECA